jgi:hypothetical protein
MALPFMQTRAGACQALLHIINQQAHHGAIREILDGEGVSVWEGSSGTAGASLGLRLLPGKAMEAALPQLRTEVARALLEDPPYAMRWMRDHPMQVRPQVPAELR